MPHCQLTLSANAGVSLELSRARLWSDVLHDKKVSGFSVVTPALWEALQKNEHFTEPDLLFYTHCHPDHYARGLTAQARALWPRAGLILPEQEFDDQILLSGKRCRLSFPGLSLEFGRLTHEGEPYAEVPNYGCVIDDGGFRILIAGDCAVANPELADLIGQTSIDLALLNFPWATLRRGRDFICQQIRPKHLVLYHLPFAPDNRWGYRESAARAADSLRDIPDVRILQDALQTEII